MTGRIGIARGSYRAYQPIPQKLEPLKQVQQISCPHCGRKFFSRDAFERHLKNYHGIVG